MVSATTGGEPITREERDRRLRLIGQAVGRDALSDEEAAAELGVTVDALRRWASEPAYRAGHAAGVAERRAGMPALPEEPADLPPASRAGRTANQGRRGGRFVAPAEEAIERAARYWYEHDGERTDEEIAAALQISRRTLVRWRKHPAWLRAWRDAGEEQHRRSLDDLLARHRPGPAAAPRPAPARQDPPPTAVAPPSEAADVSHASEPPAALTLTQEQLQGIVSREVAAALAARGIAPR